MKYSTLGATVLMALSVFAQEPAFRTSSGNPYPSVISKVQPQYTERAKKAGLEGEAVIAVTIDENGVPRDPTFLRFYNGTGQIHDSLGLSEMATSAILLWRFNPARKEGKPITFRSTHNVEFRLPK
jgi:periplasmic protein TonB